MYLWLNKLKQILKFILQRITVQLLFNFLFYQNKDHKYRYLCLNTSIPFHHINHILHIMLQYYLKNMYMINYLLNNSKGNSNIKLLNQFHCFFSNIQELHLYSFFSKMLFWVIHTIYMFLLLLTYKTLKHNRNIPLLAQLILNLLNILL